MALDAKFPEGIGAVPAGERVDAARRANAELFAAKVPQTDRRVGCNYLAAARGLFELREWHEAAILAELSLKSLVEWRSDDGGPTRADALWLLARALRRHGKRDAADQHAGELASRESLWLGSSGPSAEDWHEWRKRTAPGGTDG